MWENILRKNNPKNWGKLRRYMPKMKKIIKTNWEKSSKKKQTIAKNQEKNLNQKLRKIERKNKENLQKIEKEKQTKN